MPLPRPVRRAGAAREAFTLIELLIVMVIIAIAFFALRPGLAGVVRGAEARGAVRQLVALLTSARTEAIASGKLVRVMCEPDSGAFWAEEQVDPASDRGEFAPVRLMGRTRVLLPEQLSVNDFVVGGQLAGGVRPDAVYCYPDGRTDGATVVLTDRRGRELVVEMAPATGRVAVSA